MHPLAQYGRISAPAPGRTEPSPLAGIQAPAAGNLEPACLRSVCEILARRILHCDDLEAWPVRPDDSLAWDGDTINQP